MTGSAWILTWTRLLSYRRRTKLWSFILSLRTLKQVVSIESISKAAEDYLVVRIELNWDGFPRTHL